jgi:predicted glycoside hydrolase/deacetylase ChbG (UPF0249 family)
MKKIIFHGDDFGLSSAFNTGISIAYHQGLLRSASIRTNGTAFKEALEVIASAPDLGIGLHINLVEGRSDRTIKKADALCDSSGYYRRAFVQLYREVMSSGSRNLLVAIEDEIKDQIERLLAHNIVIDHVDSHRHTHMIPAIFRMACRLASENKIPAIRLVKEPFHIGKLGVFLGPNLIKHFLLNHFATANEKIAASYPLIYNTGFLGVMYTGFQDVETIKTGLKHMDYEPLVQVLLHPCQPNPDKPDRYLVPYLKGYINHPARQIELKTLIDSQFIQFTRDNDYQSTNFLTVANES